MLPGGWRAVAVIIGMTVVLSVALQLVKDRSSDGGVLADRIFYGVVALGAALYVVPAVRRYRRERSNRHTARGARFMAYFMVVSALIFGMKLAQSLAPAWWSSTAGTVVEWIVVLVVLALLLYESEPQQPSSSRPA